MHQKQEHASETAITTTKDNKCLVVMRISEKSFGCNILYFTPSSENEPTDFHTTDLQTGLHSIDFSADRRLV